MANALDRFFSRRIPVVLARSSTAALTALDVPHPWRGAVFDVHLPDGSGLQLLERFRERERTAPALILTGHSEPGALERATRFGAEFLAKPAAIERLHAFAARAARHREPTGPRTLEEITSAFCARHGLSPREERLLRAAVWGTARKDLASDLSLNGSTVKAQVRALLRKCGDAESLGHVVREIWQTAAETWRVQTVWRRQHMAPDAMSTVPKEGMLSAVKIRLSEMNAEDVAGQVVAGIYEQSLRLQGALRPLVHVEVRPPTHDFAEGIDPVLGLRRSFAYGTDLGLAIRETGGDLPAGSLAALGGLEPGDVRTLIELGELAVTRNSAVRNVDARRWLTARGFRP